jgi:hypothetical protein
MNTTKEWTPTYAEAVDIVEELEEILEKDSVLITVGLTFRWDTHTNWKTAFVKQRDKIFGHIVRQIVLKRRDR